MSLMKTLARVAMGVAVTKGVSSMTRGGRRGRGGLLGHGGGLGSAAGAGGLGAMLGPLLSGRSGSSGLGGLMEQMGGRSRRPGGVGRSSGGLDGLLGGLMGGAAGGAAGGGLMSQLAGRAPQPSGQPKASFGEVLNSSFDDDGEEIPPTPEQEAAAGLMLRAMVQAARADGEIDAKERRTLLGHLGGLSTEEQELVEEEMTRPADPEALAREVPEGLEQQVYAMSLMAIDVDTRAEADHLRRLASAMGLERDEVDRIHEEVGVDPLPAA